MLEALQEKKYLQFLLLLIVFIILCLVIAPSDSNYLWRLPPLIQELPNKINDAVDFVMFEWLPIEVYDPDIEEFEQKPLMKEFTRQVSGIVLFLIEFIREIFLGGVKTIVTFTGWDWATENKWARWPGLPWTVVAGGASILGYALGGTRLAIFVGFTFCYIAIFGQWEPSMQTLSFVLIAAPISVLLGLGFGIWAFKNKTVEKILDPLLRKVQLTSARRDVLIGVNQVIMQVLAMVVIASLIGAKGLGNDLLIALNRLRIGLALEIGVCIVLIAIVLDRMSLAWANKQTDYFVNQTFVERHKHSLVFAGVFVAGILLAFIGSFIFKQGFNYLYLIPHNKGITTEPFWQAGVDWVWDTFFYSLKSFNEWLIVDVLVPVKTAFLAMPVAATLVLMMGIGYIVGGIRSALIVGGLLLFIALTEWWDRALITSYIVTLSVMISGLLGMVVGTLCAQHPKSARFILTVCDTFQTFPSFIYLIPVMMLFGVTDTSVLIAIVVYATVPATRYTVQGLLSVPESLHEAGSMSGVNRFQRWISIELPMSFPHVALGINQTVVFALAMVVIGAMIGTDDLGQLILGALSERNGVGNGLVLGVCVAFIGLAVDQIIRTWANQRKAALGLA